jgi:cytoskeletal protein RodZ
MLGRLGKTPEPTEPAGPRGFDDYELRIGDVLRGERATLGKSLADVERALRIKEIYLTAIEQGDLTAFDAPSFISGYVRSYARYLGLDPDATFAHFCAETGFAPTQALSANAAGKAAGEKVVFYGGYVAPPPKGIFNYIEPGALGSLVLLVVVLCGLAFGGYSVLQEVQKVQLAPVDQAPVIIADVPPSLNGAPRDPVAVATNAAPSLPVIGAGGQGDNFAARPAQPQTLDVPILVARDGPIAAIDPRKAGVLAAAVAAAEAEAEVTVVAAPTSVEILAARPSWISVTAADGSVLFEKILDAGERYVVPALEVAPQLKAGNSSAIYFVMGDQTFGPASTGPEVVRDIDLSADAVTARYTLADMSKDADLSAFVAEIAPSDIGPSLPSAAPALPQRALPQQ